MSLADIIQRVNTTVLERAELWRPEKFVQLFVDDEPYLRFGERGIPTHRSSLFEFIEACMEAGESIIPEKNYKEQSENSRKLGEVPFFPAEMGRYKVVGMGTAYVDKKDHAIRAEGQSQEYGLHPSKEHFDKIAPFLSSWSIEIK